MNKITILPQRLKGQVIIPPSKSLAHRSIISAALCRGESIIHNIEISKDIEATMNIMEDLGGKIKKEKESLKINGENIFKYSKAELNFQCNESGSTLRFLIPIALVKEGIYIFHGKGNLGKRPLTPYYDIFKEHNISYIVDKEGLPLRIKGSLKSGIYKVPGNISSQFISGLLFALPMLKGDSEIRITTPLESRGYVDMTIDVLRNFGITIKNCGYEKFLIEGNQSYTPGDFTVEGDYSQGAFYLVAGAIGNEVVCKDLKKESLQGDKAILDILKEMGVTVELEKDYIKALPSEIKGIDIDGSQCPDLVPVLAVLSSLAKGTTRIKNVGRLRIKECDRLFAITRELNKIGGRIKELEDSLIIEGIGEFRGGTVNSHNDHRIAMALAIAATRAKEPVIIEEPLAVEKSYPKFFEDYISLGGNIIEFNNR